MPTFKHNFETEQPAYLSLRGIVAERTNRIVFWIGSGVSVAAGLPTWNGLKATLLDRLKRKLTTLDDEGQKDGAKQVESIQRDHSLWVAFKILRDSLGDTSFRTAIREILGAADGAEPPDVLRSIWRLNPAGVVSLNLDRLAARAFISEHGTRKCTEIVGLHVSTGLHVLNNPRNSFIANLHGTIDDRESWIFTQDQLAALFKNEGYKQFINSCFVTHTVVFIGISADDAAAGGHLQRLQEMGMDTGPHFWITERNDARTDKWAESAGIEIVRYSAPSNDHADLLAILEDLRTFQSVDNSPSPIIPAALAAPSTLFEPQELFQFDHEAVRVYLNHIANSILTTQDPDGTTRYIEFCKKYESCIHYAWFVSTDPPNNIVCGYRIDHEIGEGAFGTAFTAVSPDGKTVVIKLLHDRVRRQDELLQCFRRGVRSMRILEDRKVNGIVPYLAAFEIPAMVVMDYIEGPNLTGLVESRATSDWNAVLHIACQLVDIIRRSHLLPERVLHRDIKPANVIVRNGWNVDWREWEVVVLDFDLSWHRDAAEVSVLPVSSASGYLAPEQLHRVTGSKPGAIGVSTRNALVDSFGIGMTLLYLRTGIHPYANQHQSKTWNNDLLGWARASRNDRWTTIGQRFFRLIFSATRERQSERWDVSQISSELSRLSDAYRNPSSVLSAELWTEELAHRTTDGHYSWDDGKLAAVASSGRVEVEFKGNETDGAVSVVFNWKLDGTGAYARTNRWLHDNRAKFQSFLSKAGWNVDHASFSSYSVSLRASCGVNELRTTTDRMCDGCKNVLELFREGERV